MPWAIKRSELIFVCNLVKNQRIFMMFSLLYLNMNGTCDGMNFTQLLINAATANNILWKSKHRKCNITAGYYQRKLHQIYHSFIEMDQGHMAYIYLLEVL